MNEKFFSDDGLPKPLGRLKPYELEPVTLRPAEDVLKEAKENPQWERQHFEEMLVLAKKRKDRCLKFIELTKQTGDIKKREEQEALLEQLNSEIVEFERRLGEA